MYLVTIFDKEGAIMHRERFQLYPDAISWMVVHCTRTITDDIGEALKDPVSWELTKVDMRMHHKLLNIAEQGAT